MSRLYGVAADSQGGSGSAFFVRARHAPDKSGWNLELAAWSQVRFTTQTHVAVSRLGQVLQHRINSDLMAAETTEKTHPLGGRHASKLHRGFAAHPSSRLHGDMASRCLVGNSTPSGRRSCGDVSQADGVSGSDTQTQRRLP